MKLDFSGTSAKSGMILAAALALFATPFRVQANSWDKLTTITFSEPTQVTDTYLEPGTYVFKLANSDRHIVQIYNRDQTHLINTIFAIPNYRPELKNDKNVFTYWETPPGTVRAMRAWFYPDDHFGQEFRYPKDVKLVAALSVPAPALIVPPAAEATPEPAAAPVAAAPEEPAPQAAVQPEPAQEPEQLAQNTPPPVQAEPAPAPAAADPPKEPEELPKTASPYPLIGLGGLLSAGLYGLLRVRRLS